MKIVCVEWDDAVSTNGYWDRDKAKNKKDFQPVRCKTVGHLLRSNKEVVNIAGEAFEDGDYRHIHTIPRKMVKKITYLGEKGK